MGFEFSNLETFLELRKTGLQRIRFESFGRIEFAPVAYQDIQNRWYLQRNDIIEPYVREEMGVPVFTRMMSEPIGEEWIFECEFSKPPNIFVLSRNLGDGEGKYESGICIQEQNLDKLLWLLPSAYPGFISAHGDFDIPIVSAIEADISEYYFSN